MPAYGEWVSDELNGWSYDQPSESSIHAEGWWQIVLVTNLDRLLVTYVKATWAETETFEEFARRVWLQTPVITQAIKIRVRSWFFEAPASDMPRPVGSWIVMPEGTEV